MYDVLFANWNSTHVAVFRRDYHIIGWEHEIYDKYTRHLGCLLFWLKRMCTISIYIQIWLRICDIFLLIATYFYFRCVMTDVRIILFHTQKYTNKMMKKVSTIQFCRWNEMIRKKSGDHLGSNLRPSIRLVFPRTHLLIAVVIKYILTTHIPIISQ